MTAVRGEPVKFTLSATDPSLVDQAAAFTFRIDWDGNGSIDQTVTGQSGVQVTHIFASSGNYNVRVTATDKDGGQSAVVSQSVSIVNWMVRPKPGDPTKKDLVWGGSNSGEAIAFLPGGFMTLYDSTGVYVIPISSTEAIILRPPPFAITGSFDRLIAYGQGGNDLLMCDPLLVAVELHGGDGDDVLTGGMGADSISGDAGNDILFGGTLGFDASDTLDGGQGDDLVVGHYGADVLRAL